MTTTQRLTALIATLLLLLGLAGGALTQSQESVSYERFLEEPERSAERTTTPRAPTWTVEPGPDGNITPTERVRPGRETPDDPELQQKLQQQQARSAAGADDAVAEIGGYLRSDQAGPPPTQSSTRRRIMSVLSATLVAILGALAGIGVTLLRARYGKRPDPARRIKLVK